MTNFWQNKQVLVTGAGGFIGSHLVETLAQSGAQVRALVRYNSRGDWGLLKLLPTELLDYDRSNLLVIFASFPRSKRRWQGFRTFSIWER